MWVADSGGVGEYVADNGAVDVRAAIEASRKELLDLGLRNPLLNYRPSRARGVQIVDERPEEVFRILVTENKTMTFKAVPEPEEDAEPGGDGGEGQSSPSTSTSLRRAPPANPQPGTSTASCRPP